MELQKFLSPLRKAVDEYHMIEEGDQIAVGVSGGKDSLSLLKGLCALSKFYTHKFKVIAITLDMGFENVDYEGIRKFCNELGVPFFVEKTDIKTVVFDIKKEKNPCSLCAKMRRGALNNAAKAHGCNKVALGHHNDDVIETFFLSLLYEGRMSSFSPVTYLNRSGITVIRPLIYISERDIKGFIKTENIKVEKNPCPSDGYTKREEVKKMIQKLEFKQRGLKTRIFTAIKNSAIVGWNADNN